MDLVISTDLLPWYFLPIVSDRLWMQILSPLEDR